MLEPVILHVEDDSDDAFFVEYAFSNGLPKCVIRRVKDGREAIDYLDGRGEFANMAAHPKPDLVLLDLKLPDVDGFEVLQWVRSQPQFTKLQVAVLSGSSVEKDKERARQLGASAYFVKSPKYADVVDFVAGFLAKAEPQLGGKALPEPPNADSAADSQLPS